MLLPSGEYQYIPRGEKLGQNREEVIESPLNLIDWSLSSQN